LKSSVKDSKLKEKKEKDKVLVAICTYRDKEYCFKEFKKAIDKISYKNKEVIWCDTSPDDEYSKLLEKRGCNVIKSGYVSDKRINIRDGQNQLRDYFLKGDYDYFMCIESDVIVPKNIIQQLLKLNSPVASGWYDLRSGIPCISLTGPRESKTVVCPPKSRLMKKSQLQVFMAGLGVCLIRRDVLKKIEFKVFREFDPFTFSEKMWYSDVFFYLDCKYWGFPVYVKGSLYCPHIIEKNEEKE